MKKLFKIFLGLISIIVFLVLAFPLLIQAYMWGVVQVVGTSYEKHVERLDEGNLEQADTELKSFVKEISGRQNSVVIKEKEIQLPKEYKNQSQIVSKIISQIQKNDKEAIQYASLKAYPFLLRHNDINNTLLLHKNIKKEETKAVADAYLAKFYAQNGKCSDASSYSKSAEDYLKVNGLIISNIEKTKNEITVKRIVSALSDEKLLCKDYVAAFKVYKQYYPLKLSTIEDTARIYGDFAIALHDANAEEEAEFFLGLALAQADKKNAEKPKLIFAHGIYNYLVTNRVLEAYEIYNNKIKDEAYYKNHSVDVFLANELAQVGEFDKALDLLKDKNTSGLEMILLLNEAKALLSKEQYYQFLNRVSAMLDKKQIYARQNIRVIADLYELGKSEEAKKLTNRLNEQLEYLKQEDKHGYRSYIQDLILEYVRVGKVNEAEMLFTDEAIAKPYLYSKPYGALYVDYIEAKKVDKKDKIEAMFAGKRAESLYYGAASFYWENEEFDKAEAMIDKSNSFNAPDSYERLFYAKQGNTNAVSFHNNNLLAYREYRERFNYKSQF